MYLGKTRCIQILSVFTGLRLSKFCRVLHDHKFGAVLECFVACQKLYQKKKLPSVEIHASLWKSQGNFTGPHGFSWVFHGFSTGREYTGYCGLSFKLNPALNHFDQDKFDPRTPQQRFNRLFFFRIIEPKNPACSVVTHNSVLWCQGLCGESYSYRIWSVIRICLRVLRAIKKVEKNDRFQPIEPHANPWKSQGNSTG